VPGGYAAYVAARRHRRTPSPSTRPRSARPPAAAGTGRRSPSTLRHLMRQAEAEMRRLQDRHAVLEAEVAAVGPDHVALARVGREMSAVAAELSRAEDTWLALAEEAESGN
jgi:hypothetical protein